MSAEQPSPARGPAPELTALAAYDEKASALLDAYRTGTPEALERHYRLTWHRREWRAMRRYVQFDLGRRPVHGDVELTLDDARELIAAEHGFASWDALRQFATTLPPDVPTAAAPVNIRTAVDDDTPAFISRDWNAVMRWSRSF